MVKSFKTLVEEREQLIESLYSARDEVSTGLDIVFREINEASLSRLWSQVQKRDFAVITAYRGDKTQSQNVSNNRDLRGALNDRRLGSYAVVGHWRECQLKQPNGDPVDYDQCPKDQLKDVVERSYLVPRNDNVSPEEFRDLIFSLGRKYKQDGVVLKVHSLGMFGVYNPRTGRSDVKFSSGISLNKVSQAYSQYVRKLNVPFIFEGIETPNAVVDALEGYRKQGFLW